MDDSVIEEWNNWLIKSKSLSLPELKKGVKYWLDLALSHSNFEFKTLVDYHYYVEFSWMSHRVYVERLEKISSTITYEMKPVLSKKYTMKK
jgi:hypothetical protein